MVFIIYPFPVRMRSKIADPQDLFTEAIFFAKVKIPELLKKFALLRVIFKMLKKTKRSYSVLIYFTILFKNKKTFSGPGSKNASVDV